MIQIQFKLNPNRIFLERKVERLPNVIQNDIHFWPGSFGVFCPFFRRCRHLPWQLWHRQRYFSAKSASSCSHLGEKLKIATCRHYHRNPRSESLKLWSWTIIVWSQRFQSDSNHTQHHVLTRFTHPQLYVRTTYGERHKASTIGGIFSFQIFVENWNSLFFSRDDQKKSAFRVFQTKKSQLTSWLRVLFLPPCQTFHRDAKDCEYFLRFRRPQLWTTGTRACACCCGRFWANFPSSMVVNCLHRCERCNFHTFHLRAGWICRRGENKFLLNLFFGSQRGCRAKNVNAEFFVSSVRFSEKMRPNSCRSVGVDRLTKIANEQWVQRSLD